MSAARELEVVREYLPEIASHLERVGEPWAVSAVRLLERTVRAASGRGRAATRVSRERSASMRAGIRMAIAALPARLEERSVVGIARRRLARNLAAYGLAQMPCDAVIRDEVRKRNPRTEIAHAPDTAPYRGDTETDNRG